MILTKFMKKIGFDDTKIPNIDKYSSNFDEKIPFLVINCAIHKDRLNKFKKNAQKLNLKFYRIDCVNGMNYTDSKINNMFKNNLIKNTYFINQIEVSINISHINCWLKILNSSYDYGLICEDDILFKNNFKKNMNLILNNLKDNNKIFDLLYLWNGNWWNTKTSLKNILKINKDLIIKQETQLFNAGAVCYIISRNMILKLLNKILPIKNPIDIFIGTFYKNMKIYTLYNKKDISPLFKSGEWNDKFYYDDHDSQSTQDYELKSLKEIITNYKKIN
jgi:GR25 family glycosyltransferase involved in LPS biosynthesis